MDPVAIGLPAVMSLLMVQGDIGLPVGMFPLTDPVVTGPLKAMFHQMDVGASGLRMDMFPRMALAAIGRLQVMFPPMGAADTGARARKTVAGESSASNHPPTASHSMGFFRFRRSIKIAPGIRWNFGKKSSSLSFGGRGARYTVGTSGRRTTVGIPGTGISYTDIHSSHQRVTERHAGIPMPSETWIRNNRVEVTIHTPDRQPGEPSIRPDQLDTIRSITPDFDLSKVSGFGEVQADSLIEQLRYQQKEASKTLLKQFYANHGHAVSDAFIDHCYDHPGEPWKEPKKWGCFSILVAAIAIYLFIMTMYGIIRQGLK